MSSYADMMLLSQQFRAALLRQERDAASQMVSAYSSAYQSMLDRVNRLLQQIGAAQANGTPVKISWLYEKDRLTTLMQQMAREIQYFADQSYSLVLTEEQDALLSGEVQSLALMQRALPHIGVTWARVPAWQLGHLVGNLQNGSPLKDLFDKMAANGAREAGKVLFDGVAAGLGPRVIAKQLEKALSIPLRDALRISRTETIRVYNQAALENYKANSDVVDMWEWSATVGVRTCDECAGLNGKRFRLNSDQQPPPKHPNCRCAALPVTVSYEQILGRYAA